MAAPSRGSGVDWASVRRIRALLRGASPAMRAEMVGLLNEIGDDELAAQRSRIRVATGRARAALSKKLDERSLKLRVGFIGKKVNRDLFYAHVIEKGRKAQTVTVSRRSKAAVAKYGKRLTRGKKLRGDIAGVYQLRVKEMQAQPFVFYGGGAARLARAQKIQDFWTNVLARADRGELA